MISGGVHRTARCLVPQCGGGRIDATTKEMLWDKYSRERHGQYAIRAAIQRSKASLEALSEQYGINPKTVAKWRKRTSVEDRPMGPKAPRSTALSSDEETLIVAFRRHTSLPLDDCLYALHATIPHLTRSALHRLFQRHGISRLLGLDGPLPRRQFRA
jgi:transposase-like protein